jgi:hypothetical protein
MPGTKGELLPSFSLKAKPAGGRPDRDLGTSR